MRKRRNRCAVLALLLSVAMLPALPTYAGKSVSVVDTTSYDTTLDESVWHNADGDITVENGVIIFPNDSTASTKLMSKQIMKPASQLDKMFSAEFTIKFTNLPAGEKFIFGFGLQSLMTESGQRGNVEIAFFKDGGAQKVSISAFPEESKEETLIQGTSCGSGSVKVAVEVMTGQKMKVTVGGRKIYDGSFPVSGAGSVGFIQTGSCGAKVSGFVCKSYAYDTPECPDFDEDFETGFFNKNVLETKMQTGTDLYTPSQMIIKDYNGSKVLMFENTGKAYISTQHAYSNFELTFDVPFFRHQSEYDENDEVISPQSDIMGITFGEESTTSDYISGAEMFCLIGAGAGYRISNSEAINNGLVDPTGKEPYSIRLTVIDGFVKLESKFKKDAAYKELVSYQMDKTPTGHVKIWAPSGAICTFAIDNIKMVNKDKDAKSIEVEYKSSEIIVPNDFVYEPLELVYNPNAISSDEVTDNGDKQIILSVAGVCLVSLGVTTIVCMIKSRKRKVDAVDEK